MSAVPAQSVTIWRTSASSWIGVAGVIFILGFVFYDGIARLVIQWNTAEEYSHGFLIPIISLFLVWQRTDELRALPFAGSWAGVVVCLLGIALFAIGELSTLYVLVQYALVVTIAGLVLAWTGWRGIQVLWLPIVYLIFMIPLPNFLGNKLSGVLQLVSSELGVGVIRTFGISVFLEGNVIDLGTYKLQVVEACDGLRYLFPLMSFGFLCAYLFKAPFWQRALVFVSTIPIAVLMNSFRIGVIGYLVDHWGPSMAEGFLHYFEGWLIFMACIGILLLEMWLLTLLRRPRVRFRDVFGVEMPAPAPRGIAMRTRKVPPSSVVAAASLLVAVATASVIDRREEVVPDRAHFATFPKAIGEWQGSREYIEQVYLDVLQLTDYVLADYRDAPDIGSNDLVNFYVAYYGSQRKGASIHSPQTCIPGGGWRISHLSRNEVEGVSVAGQPLRINRVEIRRGENRQLVYYWFQQRGRVQTSEYLVKFFLLWDSIFMNRTDGALVRLTTPIFPSEKWSDGDVRLTEFARDVSGTLESYVPS